MLKRRITMRSWEIDEIGDFGKPALDAAAGNERLSRKDRQEEAGGPDPDLDPHHREDDDADRHEDEDDIDDNDGEFWINDDKT